MGKKCLRSRLAQLISIKKGEDYAQTTSWITARKSFALSRSALICLIEDRELEEKPSVILRTLILTLNSKKEMLYAVRCLKSNEDVILALAGQFKQLSHEPEKFR